MKSPEMPSGERVGKNERPRPLNISEKLNVKNKISLGAGLMLNTLILIDGTNIGQVHIEPSLPEILKSTEGKIRSLKDELTCLSRTQDGMTLVEITREIPIEAGTDVLALPRFITMNFGNYSVKCSFVPTRENLAHRESDAHEEMYKQQSKKPEAVVKQNTKPQQATKKQEGKPKQDLHKGLKEFGTSN